MKKIKNPKVARRNKIKRRIRPNVLGSGLRPRLCVFRSNDNMYVQLIDDAKSHTLVAASTLDKGIVELVVNKTEKAKVVGKTIAEKAQQLGIETVVFDRNGYKYHGRVKALGESAREQGLKF